MKYPQLDGLLANVCKRSRLLAFIERRAVSMESEIARVVSLTTAEISEITRLIKALKLLMEDYPEDFFPYNETAFNSKTLVPHQGGSVVCESNP